jgi:DNA-binding response OmpR family regulator
MRTILVVDDHIPTLTTLCMILNARGYHAIKAETSRRAIEQFMSNEVDLVIVDHGLPGISGTDLATQFKGAKKVLVLMLSGSPELTCTPISVDLLLAKPQSVPNLLASIAGMFEKNSQSS